MQIKVWYKLVDSNGAAFKGSSADQVTLDDDAIVVDLRDAIKNKNTTDLVNVDARRLTVFKTKL